MEIRAIGKEQLLIERAEKDIIEKLEVKNNKVIKVVKEIKKIEVKVLKNNEWQIEDELLLKERKVYVLKISYAIPPTWKLHSYSDINSKLYKPTFHSSHLSCNMSYGSTVILQIFCLPQRRYSYSTWSSMMELSLSMSQY